MSRRYGKFAALLGVALSLGVGPLFHSGVMTRPDALAELLALSGFFLASSPRSMTRAVGGVLLYLAAMTKQTALVYLLAVVLGLCLEARAKQAWVILVGVTSALLMTILVVRFSIEPNFVVCLLGESRIPVDFESWWHTISTIAVTDPELFILTIAGIVTWSRGPTREPMTAVLAVLLLASSVVTAAKRGSAENYFLGLRSVAALAVGALWHNMFTSASRPRVWEIVTVAAVAGGTAFSILNAAYFWRSARQVASVRATGPGKAAVQFYQRLFREAEDPRTRFLTDVGIIDIRQGERTVFADSYKLKLMGENGQFDTKVIQDNIDHEYYDAIVCRSDLFSPSYETYDFGLPMILAERARRHYRLSVAKHGLYIYHRRGKQPGTAEKPRPRPPQSGPLGRLPPRGGKGAVMGDAQRPPAACRPSPRA